MSNMQKRNKIVIANWKMNPLTSKEAITIAKETAKSAPKNITTVIAPPFPFLTLVSKEIAKKKNVALGAQNINKDKSGAKTGEVSSSMIESLSVKYCIIGHSERRAMGESDMDVASKVLALKSSKITPVLCIGEKERDEHGHYLDVIKNQLLSSLQAVPANFVKEIIFAYEPIWAIGKEGNEAMSAHDLHQTSLFIRKVLVDSYGKSVRDVPVIYGGAVAPENAASLIKDGDVDGFLVGHQSLKPKAFAEILKAVSSAK